MISCRRNDHGRNGSINEEGMKDMFRKSVLVLLAAAICFSGASCTLKNTDGTFAPGVQGSGTQKSNTQTEGKPYINESAKGDDGIGYYTEEGQTDNFIAFTDEDGEVALFPLNEGKSAPYYPDGLCDVKPGEIYTIKYDAQHITGGIAGRNDIYFLKVYSCEAGDYGTLFENGYYKYGYNWSFNYPLKAYLEGSYYLAFPNSDGGFDVYSKTRKTHYDEKREILYPVTVSSSKEPVELEFNVICNKDLTDEYIIDHIISRNPDDAGFILYDCDHSGDFPYDSLERFAVDEYYHYSMLWISADEEPSESRMFISHDDIATKSAAELGLSEEVYNRVYKGWEDMRDGAFCTFEGYEQKAKVCDVILFSGDYGGQAGFTYDTDLRILINDSWFNYGDVPTERYQYIALYIRPEFNELFPQE